MTYFFQIGLVVSGSMNENDEDTKNLFSLLPLEVTVKIVLLVSDYQTIESVLEYVPVVKNIPSVIEHKKSLRKDDFLKTLEM